MIRDNRSMRKRRETKRLKKERKGSRLLEWFVPGGYIPTLETKQRECWKFKTRGVNSEFDSRVSVRPSNILFSSYVRGFVIQTMLENSLFLLVSYPLLCSPTCVSLFLLFSWHFISFWILLSYFPEINGQEEDNR